MATTFTVADEVETVATPLIEEHYQYLTALGVRVEYVFRDDTPKSGGRERWGEARKISNLAAFLAGSEDERIDQSTGAPFFVITISEPVWRVLKPKQRQALVDHELRHCFAEEDDEGEVKLTIIGHDLEEFSDIVRRYGLWREDVRLMAEAIEPHRHQLRLRLAEEAA